MNLCTVCHQDFASLSAFDEHRVGEHDFTFQEGVNFDIPRYDGRRCLDMEEMTNAGWRRDRWTRWQLPLGLEPHLIERVAL